MPNTHHWKSTSSTSFTTAGNWSDGNAPGNGDTLIFNSLGTANVETDLSTALTTVTVIVEQSYQGRIGTLSSAGVAAYLVLDGGTLIVGQNTGGSSSGQGSPLVLVDFGSTTATATIYDSASTSYNAYYPPIMVKGSSLNLVQYGGKVGIAPLTAETATLVTGKLSKGANPGIGANLYLGRGTTVTAMNAGTGTILNRSSNTTVTTVLSGDSSYTYDGSGAHTTLTVNTGAKAIYSGTGTVTTLNLNGTFDRTKDGRALTLTTTNLYRGANFLLDNGVGTSTTRSTVNLVQCAIQELGALTLPAGEKL